MSESSSVDQWFSTSESGSIKRRRVSISDLIVFPSSSSGDDESPPPAQTGLCGVSFCEDILPLVDVAEHNASLLEPPSDDECAESECAAPTPVLSPEGSDTAPTIVLSPQRADSAPAVSDASDAPLTEVFPWLAACVHVPDEGRCICPTLYDDALLDLVAEPPDSQDTQNERSADYRLLMVQSANAWLRVNGPRLEEERRQREFEEYERQWKAEQAEVLMHEIEEAVTREQRIAREDNCSIEWALVGGLEGQFEADDERVVSSVMRQMDGQDAFTLGAPRALRGAGPGAGANGGAGAKRKATRRVMVV